MLQNTSFDRPASVVGERGQQGFFPANYQSVKRFRLKAAIETLSNAQSPTRALVLTMKLLNAHVNSKPPHFAGCLTTYPNHPTLWWTTLPSASMLSQAHCITKDDRHSIIAEISFSTRQTILTTGAWLAKCLCLVVPDRQ